jgi:TatD DNase family protein
MKPTTLRWPTWWPAAAPGAPTRPRRASSGSAKPASTTTASGPPRSSNAPPFAQLALGRELDLPVIIHDRDAHADIMAILRSDGHGTRGVMHSFSGDIAMAEECLRLGYVISLSGPVTFPKAADRHAVAAWVPLSGLLVETDCPYLTPVPHRGRRNEPAYVAHTAARIAALKGLPLEEVAAATTANTAALFGLP